jgi:small-conductance mechanosensitive channel
LDHNLIVSPNSDLTKAKVINYSYPHPEMRVLVEFMVAYGTDIDQARKIMLQFAYENEWVLRRPEAEVFLSAAAESSCTLQLVARTDDWKKKFKAEAWLRENIYKAFLKEGIKPGYPQRVIHLSSPLPYDTSKND